MYSIETIQSINHILAIGSLFCLCVLIVLCIDLCNKRIFEKSIKSWGLISLFLITFFSSILTLIYSEIFGVVPCGLCWFERVFLYPQVLLTFVALYMGDRHLPMYGIPLSICGMCISLYHHYLQMGGSAFIKCPAAGGTDCAKRFLFEFNFVTFPLIAAILFLLLLIVYVYLIQVYKK